MESNHSNSKIMRTLYKMNVMKSIISTRWIITINHSKVAVDRDQLA